VKENTFAFESQTYTAYTSTNVDFDTDILRYGYQSMATPSSVDFNMKTKESGLEEQQVLEESLIKITI
jgi:oligopeptidase B